MVILNRIMLELKRRKVFRAAAFYIVGAWVAIQVVDQALPALNTPDEAIRGCEGGGPYWEWLPEMPALEGDDDWFYEVAREDPYPDDPADPKG